MLLGVQLDFSSLTFHFLDSLLSLFMPVCYNHLVTLSLLQGFFLPPLFCFCIEESPLPLWNHCSLNDPLSFVGVSCLPPPPPAVIEGIHGIWLPFFHHNPFLTTFFLGTLSSTSHPSIFRTPVNPCTIHCSVLSGLLPPLARSPLSRLKHLFNRTFFHFFRSTLRLNTDWRSFPFVLSAPFHLWILDSIINLLSFDPDMHLSHQTKLLAICWRPTLSLRHTPLVLREFTGPSFTLHFLPYTLVFLGFLIYFFIPLDICTGLVQLFQFSFWFFPVFFSDFENLPLYPDPTIFPLLGLLHLPLKPLLSEPVHTPPFLRVSFRIWPPRSWRSLFFLFLFFFAPFPLELQDLSLMSSPPTRQNSSVFHRQSPGSLLFVPFLVPLVLPFEIFFLFSLLYVNRSVPLFFFFHFPKQEGILNLPILMEVLQGKLTPAYSWRPFLPGRSRSLTGCFFFFFPRAEVFPFFSRNWLSRDFHIWSLISPPFPVNSLSSPGCSWLFFGTLFPRIVFFSPP